MSPTKLKNKKLCEDHFTISAFINSSKQRLVHNAVPIPFGNSVAVNSAEDGNAAVPPIPPLFLRRTKNPKTYARLQISRPPVVINVAAEDVSISPTLQSILKYDTNVPLSPKSPTLKVGFKRHNIIPCKSPLVTADTKTLKIKAQRSEILRLRRKIRRMSAQNKKNGKHSLFIKTQLEHKPRQRWGHDMINLAMNIYYTSPACYKKLRQQGITLPGISTLQSYLNRIDILPGFSNDVFSRLKLKVQNWSTQERLCVLMFDEIAIKRNLEYSKKYGIVEGFQDLGDLGRTNAYASEALVFMVSGLCNRWKIPIAYFLSANSTKAEYLKILLLTCIKKLKECGLIVKVVVCDQGSGNRSTIAKLNITKSNPVLKVENDTIYFFYDVPHLIKSVRNQLILNDFIFNNERVSWNVIIQTYNLDKQSEKARSLPKLSDQHVYPNNFQKMRCKLAFQVFSDSMVASIRTSISTKQLPMSYLATSEFIKFMNDLGDSLNSSNLYTKNKNRAPLSPKNGHIKNMLENGLKTLGTLRTVLGKVPPCFEGLFQSITACLMLYDDLNKNYQVKYLLTRRLTQDALENAFAIFRHKGGSNDNPTARSFRLSFRHLFCANLKKNTSSSNCEDDQQEFIFNVQDSSSSLPLLSSASSNIGNTDTDASEDEEKPTSSKSSIKVPKPTLEDCSVRYTAGFILRKCLHKYKCKTCETQLKIAPLSARIHECNEKLIQLKTYNGVTNCANLCVPNNVTNDVVNIALKVFAQFYPLLKHKQNLLDKLFKIAERKIIEQSSYFQNCFESCKPHRKFIVRYTLQVRLLKQVTWESRTIGKSRRKIQKKIKKISHK